MVFLGGYFWHIDVFSMPLQSGDIFMSLWLALTYGQTLALTYGQTLALTYGQTLGRSLFDS